MSSKGLPRLGSVPATSLEPRSYPYVYAPCYPRDLKNRTVRVRSVSATEQGGQPARWRTSGPSPPLGAATGHVWLRRGRTRDASETHIRRDDHEALVSVIGESSHVLLGNHRVGLQRDGEHALARARDSGRGNWRMNAEIVVSGG